MDRLQEREIKTCDVLVIGGGGAGLRAAITARRQGTEALVASKTRIGYTNNTYISLSAFAATGLGEKEDTAQVHLRDTVMGGRYINDQKLAAEVARLAADQVAFLQECGVRFAERDGRPRVDRTPGHSYARHVRAQPALGREYMIPLRARAEELGVGLADHLFVSRLFISDGRIVGAAGVDQDGAFVPIRTKAVILATGGFAHIYHKTNNAPGITGDGQALAYESGVPLKDIEFVQFYPTARGPLGNRGVLYEAVVFRAGAKLRNARGEDVLVKHDLTDPMVVTRDRVARAIMREIQDGLGVDGAVIMDLRPIPADVLERIRPLFPASWSVDQPEIRVSPTTHFCMGGVMINEATETRLPGLFAAGEVTAGMHGANRLGGNALTEIFAMGGVAGESAVAYARNAVIEELPQADLSAEKDRLAALLKPEGTDLREIVRSLKEAMWTRAGVIRSASSLTEMLGRLEELKAACQKARAAGPGDLRRRLELEHMLLVSEMVCRAALMRTESRGAHYRTDFPDEDDAHWLKNIVIEKQNGRMILTAVPVALDLITPN